MTESTQKTHRKRQAGPKAAKSKAVKTKGNNPKAFAFQSINKAERAARRTLDKNEKRMHCPMVDRTPVDAPPVVVAVVGPPQVGKSSLIRSLVKRYTKHALNDIKGPITVVGGKNQRITFIECANDINAMIDVAKIADLVLLLIDASFGFEMETFEFLNVIQSHGFPKVIGVLTHLDSFKDNKQLKKTKKRLKQRFWTEIYQGAKLFYLSGMINGKYLKNEVHNLSRFISIMKFRPLSWRNEHPYLLVDRIEDMTNPELKRVDPKVDRVVTVYGYLRGTQLKPNMKVHIPGAGDQQIDQVTLLPDPCPLPKNGQRDPVTGKKVARRTLNDKDKLIYAPMTDVNGILYDRDAVYIHIPDHLYREDGAKKLSAGEELLNKMKALDATLDEKLAKEEVSIFSGQRRRVVFEDEDCENDDIDEDEDSQNEDEELNEDDLDELNDDELDEDDIDEKDELDEDNIDEEDELDHDSDTFLNESNWELENDAHAFEKENIEARSKELLKTTSAQNTNLMTLVYGKRENYSETQVHVDGDDLFVKVNDILETNNGIDDLDCSKFISQLIDSYKERMADLRSRFITGPSKDEMGDFEDLEEDKEKNEQDDFKKKRLELKQKFDEQYDDGEAKKPDTLYDQAKAELEAQSIRNKEMADGLEEEERIKLLGFSPGSYVRIVMSNVPCELIENFSPYYPVILGGLQMVEEKFGFVHTRIKRHRWYKKILKTNDPLIISLGWRRFQTLPLYSLCTDGERNRMIKYTPEHMHCTATFYGPINSPNTGFCAFQATAGNINFRVAATGVVLDMNQSTSISKKLKLTGSPYKILKKTAFIKDMFSSSLEVAKFEGASIRTVSGLRGQIKKALPQTQGHFRATFEDKILMSDIVFLKTWVPVEPKVFYNPVTSLLLADKKEWKGMRLTSQVRHDEKAPLKTNPDSIYKPIERRTRNFNPLKIPKKLAAQLPFATKPKLFKTTSTKGYLAKRAVVLEPEERKANALIHQLGFIQHESERKKTEKKLADRAKYLKVKALADEKLKEKEKTKMKRVFQAQGMKEKRQKLE